mmetsp:Transcript_71959/g.201951  ORF Transcript_71959/g.201951 Transcript_71959/m.201951 type:complete len:118 (-) Transcript_71959:97-450(-)
MFGIEVHITHVHGARGAFLARPDLFSFRLFVSHRFLYLSDVTASVSSDIFFVIFCGSQCEISWVSSCFRNIGSRLNLKSEFVFDIIISFMAVNVTCLRISSFRVSLSFMNALKYLRF